VPPPESALRRSLRACTVDAGCHAAMVGFGEGYFPAFALLLGASPFQVGVLATVPILIGAGFQLLATMIAQRLGQRRWVIASAAVEAVTFLPIAWLSRGVRGGYTLLFAWVCLYWMLQLGINPAWNAWMGRMIPPDIRSRYFGRRNVAVHSLIFLSLLAGGFLIDGTQRWADNASLGFAATFLLAGLSRTVSVWFLTRQHDPGTAMRASRWPVRELLVGFWQHPYGQLILLIVLINGAVQVSAAYFTPFMLHELNLSYARFTILNGTIVMARVLSSSYWGEIARTYGNRRALQVSAVLLIPLSSLWVVSDNYAYLLALQLFAGFAWAGFELTTFLNLFDCTDDHNRAAVLSLYNLLNGVMIVSGSLCGGTILRATGGHGYRYIFVLSSTCRALVVAGMIRGVGVQRRAYEHSFRNVFTRVLTLRPGQGADLRPVVMNEEPKHRRAADVGGGKLD
jgi:MFS family permease